MKKKIVALMIAVSCVFAFAGCGQKQETAAPAEEAAAEEEAAEPAEEDEEAVAAADTTIEAVTPEEAEEPAEEAAEGATAAIANPWKEFDTAEEAAQNAGIEPMDLAEMTIDLGPVTASAYRSMDSLVETVVEFPAVEMTIRKGKGFEDGDCSGDYNTYAHEWTQNIKGLEVKCFGNDEGRSTKTIWSVGDYSYSINVIGLGGDDNFGLDADSINSLINGMQ